MRNQRHTPLPNRFREAVDLGLRVFPAKPRLKKPALEWAKYQTVAPTDEDIARWDASDFNVCIVTGTPGGVVVFDEDSEQARELLDGLNLPLTATVRTARGRHLYFRAPAKEFKNEVNLRGVKLDFRGVGGYVIGPGSIHPDGSLYEWENSPAEVGIAAAPPQLLKLLEEEKPKQRRPKRAPVEKIAGVNGAGIERYVADELGEAVKGLGAAVEGERNDTLFKVSARMARHVAGAGVDWSEVAAALAVAAGNAGLEDAEIAPTIESGWRAGSAEPTAWIRIAAEHVYLSAQERFYHIASGRDLRPAGFNGHYGHEYSARGTFANFLLRTNSIHKVHDLTYEPLEAKRFTERDGLEYLNTYRPSAIVGEKGDAGPFEDFLAGLVPDADEREHLLKMIAFTVRNPGQKLRYALVLRSAAQGVGKSMLARIWGDLLGTHNVRTTTPNEIASDYQGYLPQTLLVVVEELNLGAGFKTYNAIKDMITGDVFTVNEKHLRQRQWRIYATFVFFSNLEQPILVEANDRRLFYIDSPCEPRGDQYYLEFSEWWSAHLAVIRGYLDSVDLDGFNPHKPPPMTEGKRALIAGSRSELAKDLQLAINMRHDCFDRDLVTLNQVAFSMGRRAGDRKVVEALNEIGAVGLKQQRVGGQRLSLWAIRNAKYWCFASKEAREKEFLSAEGSIFADLDGTGIEVAHIDSMPDREKLIAGFEAAFGLSKQAV